MLKRTTTLIIALFLIASTADVLYAQDDTRAKSGSFYSAIGFGVPADVYSGATMGIGLPGVSTYDGFSPNIANPAHWGLINYTQGNIALGLNTYRSVDNSASARNTLLNIEGFQFAFPLLRNKLGVSISFTPLVRADFKRNESGSFNALPGLNQEDVQYIISTLGTGGVNRFEIGFGYQPIDNISVGYGFSANLLSINNEVTPFFSDAQYAPSPYEVGIEGYEFGHRFGLFAYKGNLFRQGDQLSFGTALTLPVSIEAEKSLTMFRSVEQQRQLIEFNENDSNRNGNVKLPLEFNSGLTYNLSRFMNVVAEFQLQQWSDAEFSFNPTQQEYFKNRMKTGIGFQLHPYRSEQRGGFFSNFKYSLGTTYDSGHLSIQNQDIETLLLHAGLGLVSRTSRSSIDLSFHYGIRGTESSNLVKENIWGFKLSLNLAELMFIQQRFQ
ncbi:MAG: hypothetical protein U5K72_03930 [Balneolaceae bacterium]|nr:hypothetical protein [Balneolaceae bacterium]